METKTETKTVRYEYVEGLNSDNPDVVTEVSTEYESQTLEQFEEGYIATDIAGNEDIQFTEYSFTPELDAEAELVTSKDFAELDAKVVEQQDLGNELISVSYSGETEGETQILSYFGEAEYGISYEISDNADELVNLINDEDLSLQNVEYGNGTWLATFDHSGNPGSVSVGANFDELTGQIQGKVSDGSTLVDLEYGDGTWIARYSEYGDNSTTSSYYVSDNLDLFKEEIVTQQEGGFDLVDVEYVEGSWYGVFNQGIGTENSGNYDVNLNSSDAIETFENDTLPTESVDILTDY
jgi:hypothetical protein